MGETTGILNKLITKELSPVFHGDGFRGSGRTFTRVRGELIHLVNIQGSSWGGSFAVNLAVHLMFLPDVRGFPADPRKISESLCEFRRRMTAPSASDQWWRYDDNEDSIRGAVLQAKQVYLEHGRAQLEFFRTYPDDFVRMTPENISSPKELLGGFHNTFPRLALIFARIRLHEGDLQSARRFAQVGLEHVDQTSLLADLMRDVIKSTDR